MSEIKNLSRAIEILEQRREASPQEIYSLAEELKLEKQFRLARRLKEVADVARSRNILRGEDPSNEDEKYELAMSLKDANQFGIARKLLGRVKPDKIVDTKKAPPVKIGQQHALCTYKDPDLPADSRLKRAFEILKKTDDPKSSTDPETLGLAGAIYKRMWEFDAQTRHLERSLTYYTRGYKTKKPGENGYDYGYTGINAAFIQDLLASQEEAEASEAGAESESAKARRAEASKIRKDLVAVLPGLKEQETWLADKWWYYVTIAEAHFGLAEYAEASPWLAMAASIEDVPDWQRTTTTRQLAHIARLHMKGGGAGTTPAAAKQVLRDFLTAMGDWSEAAIESAFQGKMGLALSGGGLRASLFHIGVLARLAELDVLRHIEVLSCVSGGSIIGTHYYLELRRLLAQQEEITHEEYVALVKRIEERFLAGVKRNIRMHVAANWWTNVKMVFSPNHSRTKRAGELYEREFYGRVEGGDPSQPLFLDELTIQPAGAPEKFRPKYDNWRRSAKVPDLILNATTLNTGHNWQFTATWMGEPPSSINSEIDGNYRLRRLYHSDAPVPFRKKYRVRLGDAVGASACVPGLFEPIALTRLYGERGEQPRETQKVVVRLVDGGVHDNQGVASLLEQGCSHVIVSDASGQMDTIDDPSSGLLAVPLRSNGILQARVREAQHQELVARRRASLLQGLIFIHLKKDLGADPLDWLDCKDRWTASDEARPPEASGDLTTYGVKKDVQRLLSSVRTDLDSFSEAEAYALMMSGYAMIERAPAGELRNFFQSKPIAGKFRFLNFREPMRGGRGYAELVRRLKVSHLRGFKIWKLLTWLRVSAWLLGGIVLAGLILLCWWLWAKPQFQFTLGVALALLSTVAVGTVLVGVIGPPVQRFLHWRKTPSEFGIGLAMATLGFIAAWVHLLIFDRLFLSHGRAKHIVGDVGRGGGADIGR
jgi:predicted acylesterase/phospholipase RssA